MEVSPCSRKRPCGGADLQLHQEVQCQPPACKRRCRGEEEGMNRRKRRCREEMMKRRRGRKRRTGRDCENTDLQDSQKNMRTQNLKRQQRRENRYLQSGTRLRTGSAVGSGLRSEGEVQSCRPELRVALIRRTSDHPVKLTGPEPDQSLTDPGSTETHLRQWRLTQVGQTRTTESTSETRSRSRPGPLKTVVVVSETRTRRRFERVKGPESHRGEGEATEIMSRSRSEGGKTVSRTETRTRRKRKIHPSEFRGRGQLRLSITPEAEQLIIHIHEARGLMGKSPQSCDSYVKLSVTSDLDCSIRMKTPTVLNNKNPEYNQRFILCVHDDLVLSRLLVSVFSRCSQLIGCMSFGIGSLLLSSKLVTGWFYLLGEEFGQSKHLRVTSQQSRPMRRPETAADLRRTPDSAPDTDMNRITTPASTTTNLSNCSIATGLKHQPHDPTNTNHSSGPANGNYGSYISALYGNTNQLQAATDGSSQQLMVSVVRGKDGFGFTICSDSPVRVQAVDSGGPAHQSGLRQGDSVLQLNGLPVETWKCVDLAHAIRSCPSQIVLVVWRGLPELRSGCESLLRPPTHNTTTGRKLLPHPAHSKHGRRRGQGSGIRSSLGALGSLWRDRKEDCKEEEEKEEEEAEDEHNVTEYSACTTTLKGTRMTSSQGGNYIILSPVSPGGQLLQPVYPDRNRTIGRLYQTHPSRGQNLLHEPRPGLINGHDSNLPPSSTSSSSSSALSRNYGNYQNCTIVQSHLPCSTYGTYVSLTPKTLIFPIFVQPLDLCNPDRTLLMSEEMILHQADLLPTKVTVLIYSDLLLFTREDEARRCHVLQCPVYLNTLQLREVPSEPLLIYFLQDSVSLFSLESFSIEQKVRVSLCLHDNMQLQLVTTETGHTHQLSDLPSDFGLLSLQQSDLLYRPSSLYSSFDPPLLHPSSPLRPSFPSSYSPSSPFSSTPPSHPLSSLSPYTFSSSSPPSRTFTSSSPPSSFIQKSPVWKERGETEEQEEERRERRREEQEVEERQQGEGESASETSENVGGVVGRGLILSPHPFDMKEEDKNDEEDELEEGGGPEEFISTYRPIVLRRFLSEGSLLQEPRSPRFLSDSTIHRLTRPATFDFDLDPSTGSTHQRPSIHTLRKQLTREGGSLHHMMVLLSSTKDADCRNHGLRKKTKSLAADVRSRLAFLWRRNNSTNVHSNSLEKALRNNRPSTREVLRWAGSLEALLTNQYGLAMFRYFLRSEFSEENLDFWLAVERFKKTCPLTKMAARAAEIYDEFISTNAARQVNVDSSVRESTSQSLLLGVNPISFQLAQDQIFGLMESDSYPRFLKSRIFAQLANQDTQTVT